MKIAVLLLVTLLAVAHSSPAGSRQQEFITYFSDRRIVESIIQCFLDKKPCNAEEKKIKVRAMATMRNFGVCPSDICSPSEREEMSQAMTLLAEKHPDLWAQLIASMFGIDLGR